MHYYCYYYYCYGCVVRIAVLLFHLQTISFVLIEGCNTSCNVRVL